MCALPFGDDINHALGGDRDPTLQRVGRGVRDNRQAEGVDGIGEVVRAAEDARPLQDEVEHSVGRGREPQPPAAGQGALSEGLHVDCEVGQQALKSRHAGMIGPAFVLVQQFLDARARIPGPTARRQR